MDNDAMQEPDYDPYEPVGPTSLQFTPFNKDLDTVAFHIDPYFDSSIRGFKEFDVPYINETTSASQELLMHDPLV